MTSSFVELHLCAVLYAIFVMVNAASVSDTGIKTVALWDRDSVDVTEGENVTVTCTVTGVNLLSVVRLVHAHHSTSVLIADNDLVKEQFVKLERYRVLYHLFDNIATLVVQVTGIRGEDSGLLTCHLLDDDVIAAHVNVTVQVPIRDVYVVELTPDGEEYRVDEGRDVSLAQHDSHGVGCVTSLKGSYVEPSLNVTFGDRDVTDLFQLDVERTPVLMESGLTLFYVTVRRTLVTSQPDADSNGQLMTCVAAVQSGYAAVTASAILNVQFAPIISCPGQVTVRRDDPVTLDCIVRANPGSRITWSTPNESHIRDVSVSTHSTALSADESQVFLTIDSVFDRYYGNYTLRADNLIGSSRATVTLVPGRVKISTTTTKSLPADVRKLHLKQDARPKGSQNRVRSSEKMSGRGSRHEMRKTVVGVATLLSVISVMRLSLARAA